MWGEKKTKTFLSLSLFPSLKYCGLVFQKEYHFVILLYQKCQKKIMGISGWVPSTDTSPEHLLPPSSLTFPVKAHSERAPQWALPTRGMKHLTVIRAFTIPQIFLLACYETLISLCCLAGLTQAFHPGVLSGPNATGWILKPFPFPLAWQPRGV